MLRHFIICICLSSLGLFGQELYQNVRGQIVDEVSSMPLAGANVILMDTNIFRACVTDINGEFKLEKVPIGRQTIKITYIGYEEKYISNLLVTTGKELVLKVNMEESLQQLEMVTVKAPDKHRPINTLALVSAQSFSIEQSERYAASINDPARLAQSFAGVAQSSDFGNEISIRGNSPKGLLWQVEGLTMPNPNHYGNEGGGGGVVSILSNNVLDHSDFFTGAFPAEYGNATAGVFDFHLRPGNNDKKEYTLEIGMIGVDAAIEGPFTKNGNSSYLANYRYSTLGLMEKLGYDLEGRSVTSFQDLNMKLHFPLKNKGEIGLFAIGGSSTTSFDKDLGKRNPSMTGIIRRERYFYDVGMAGITYDQPLSKNTRLNSSFGIGGYRLTESRSIIDSSNTLYENKFQSGDYSFRANIQANHKFDTRNYLKAGFRFSRLNFLSYQATRDTADWERTYEAKGMASYSESFAQWKHRASERLVFTAGLHSSYFEINKQVVVEPRLAMRYKLRPDLSLRMGMGMHSMLESLLTYLGDRETSDIERPNMDLKMARAIHYVLGADKSLGNNWQIGIEAYYQDLYDVPIKNDSSSSWSSINKTHGKVVRDLINEGTGFNYGMELSLRKAFDRNWYMMANASLFESKYKTLDGVLRNTIYNNNFIYNLTAGKDFKVGRKKSNIFGANMKVLWMGGRRTTPIDLERSVATGETKYTNDNVFGQRMPDYFRLDARVSYRKNNPKWSWVFSLDVQNLTNRYNLFKELYDPILQEIDYMEQVGIVPAFKFRIEL